MKTKRDSATLVDRVVMPQLSVYLIDGEDMIVATNEQEMKRIYRDYHWELIRGRDCRLLKPDEMIPLTDGSDNEWEESASSIGQSKPQYIASYR